MLDKVFTICDQQTHYRSINDIFIYATSEMGELAEEVGIVNGFVNKPAGKDGILGESVDTIICLLDLIRKTHPNLSVKELTEVVNITISSKLQKWVDKYPN